jgi:hypothetical protein
LKILLFFEKYILTITIEYSGALCSAGKTEFACRLMATQPDKYLLAVDRREVMEARIARIDEKAAAAGTYPVCRSIYSKSEGRFEDGTGNVRQTLREQPTQDIHTPHVVVVCTHEGLLSSDLSTYQGWTLIIDENPNVWAFGEVQSEYTWPIFERFFGLEPNEDEWSQVTVCRDAPTMTALAKDTAISPKFVEMYRRWQNTRPMVKLTQWDEASDGRQWSWCSVWNPEKLDAFQRIMILANSFTESITYKLLKRAGVHLVPFSIHDDREWVPRTVLLRYFASQHQAGTGFWTNDSDSGGKEALGKTFEWISHNSDPENHYYSTNLHVLKSTNLPGIKLQPKVSGSDAYKHLTCASFIYTAKPSQAEVAAFSRYGITYDEIVRARQNEDLVQFLFRSNLRVPDDPRDVEFRVYDLQQATFVKEFIESTGRPFMVVLEHVADAGVDDHKPKSAGRPKVARTEAEKQVLSAQAKVRDKLGKRRRRQAQKQSELEEGIIRLRGRPPKNKPGTSTIPPEDSR